MIHLRLRRCLPRDGCAFRLRARAGIVSSSYPLEASVSLSCLFAELSYKQKQNGINHQFIQCLLTLGRSTSPPLDQFPVRVCSCPLCIMNRLRKPTNDPPSMSPSSSVEWPSNSTQSTCRYVCLLFHAEVNPVLFISGVQLQKQKRNGKR